MPEIRFIEIPNPNKGNGVRYGDAALQLLNEAVTELHDLDVAAWKRYGHDVGKLKPALFKSLSGAMDKKTYRATLILVCGKPVGIAMTMRDKNYVAFWNFIITKEYRRQGYGRRLLQHCADMYRKRGCTEFSLVVHGDNTAANMLYLSAGFKIRSTTLSLKLQG